MPNRITLRNSEDNQNTNNSNSFNLFELMTLLIQYRKTLFGTVGAVMIITALIVLLIPNQYKSVATLLPSGPADKMAEIKALAGLGSLSSSDENSSQLFPTILKSYSVRQAVLDSSYQFEQDGEMITMTLLEYFDLKNSDKLHRALASITQVGVDKKTGVITFAVETESPGLSQVIAAEFISELESFNLLKRRSHAKDNCEYLSRELNKRKNELMAVEDSLTAFQQANRSWDTSTNPFIMMTIARYKRTLEMKNQTLLYLNGEMEVAKLDAKKDMPIVQVLDHPSRPLIKSSPARTATVLIVGVVTFVFMLFVIVVSEAAKRASRGVAGESFEIMRTEVRTAFPRSTRTVNRLLKIEKISVD